MKPKPLIIIVEDEPLLRESVAERFENAGFIIRTFTNGLEMLANISELKPDIILLDIMTPEIDGFGVLEAIKKNFSEKRFEHIPIVVWSNISDQPTIDYALRLGARAYLSKVDYIGERLVEEIKSIVK